MIDHLLQLQLLRILLTASLAQNPVAGHAGVRRETAGVMQPVALVTLICAQLLVDLSVCHCLTALRANLFCIGFRAGVLNCTQNLTADKNTARLRQLLRAVLLQRWCHYE